MMILTFLVLDLLICFGIVFVLFPATRPRSDSGRSW